MSCQVTRPLSATTPTPVVDLYNGFLDLSKIFWNGRPCFHTIALTKQSSKPSESPKSHVTIMLEPKVNPILRSPSALVSLTLSIRYVVEFESDRLLRHTLGYFLKVTVGPVEEYVRCSLQKEEILDVGNLCLMAAHARKYYSSIKDRKYSLYLRSASEVTLETTPSQARDPIYFELYTYPRDQPIEEILRQGSAECNKIAEGSKSIVEFLE